MAKRANIWVYPTGIIGTTITMYLFFTDRLLGDMLMNAYYSLMSIYGWWEWSRQKDGEKVRQITTMTSKEKGLGLALVLITMLVTYMIYHVTNTAMDLSNVIDIFTSGVFFTAMWLMARKKLESWIQEQEFKKDQALKDSFFSGVHKMYAFLLDVVTRGEGHVRTAVENDHSLRDAIAQEGAGLLAFINNKARIGLLTGGAVISGKMTQKRENSKTGFASVAVCEAEETKEQQQHGNLPGTTELPAEVHELDIPFNNETGEGGREQPDCEEEGVEGFDP